MSATIEHHFSSDIKLLDKFDCPSDADTVKNEPMFFNAGYQFAFDNGGPITREFLTMLPREWKQGIQYKDLVFDSRVHLLMPGWFPCIPGYHHDDVARHEATGQPDYDNLRYKSEHIMGLVNADISPTKFVLGNCPMPPVNAGEVIYKKWHNEVESLIGAGKVKAVDAPDKQLVYFDWKTFHTGTRAVKNGWRWFGRISRNTDRTKKITNEIRRQAQVYLEFPMEGW